MNDENDYVKVPVSELQKLEQSRLKLYGFLERELEGFTISQQIEVQNITDQIWRVANTKKW